VVDVVTDLCRRLTVLLSCRVGTISRKATERDREMQNS
jgi:hypothetical protein